MTLAQAHALVPGSALVGDGAVRFERVHSDTRTLRAGDLFVALRGERFDAHDFLPQARAAGAVAALAERGLAADALPGLPVADSLHGLQQMAAGLAPPHAPAVDRGDGQQRQDHRDADGRQHPACVVRRCGVGDQRQPQQPHRRAADGAAAAPGRLPSAPRRGARTGHEPSRRDRAAGAASPRPPSCWSTTPSASTRSSWPAWKRSRSRTAARSKRCRRPAWRCSRPTMRRRRSGARQAGRVHATHVRPQRRSRRHRRRLLGRRPLDAARPHAGRCRRVRIARARRAQPAQRAGRRHSGAGRRRAARGRSCAAWTRSRR